MSAAPPAPPAPPAIGAAADRADGERLLWLRVVYQAFEDAADRRDGRDNAGGERSETAAAARAWLSVDCPDFRHVCGLAGLDPSDVAAAARRQLDSGATPQELRKRLWSRVEGKRGDGGRRSRISAAA